MDTLGNTRAGYPHWVGTVNTRVRDQLVTAFISDLRAAISLPRLDKYRPVGGTDLDMAVNHFWNIAHFEALYPDLAVLEVTLRSSIHQALTT